MGDPDAPIGVSGLDHHQPDLYHLNRLDTGRFVYHSVPYMGLFPAAEAPQASRARVVEVLEAGSVSVDGTP